jgi:hypothetical protein
MKVYIIQKRTDGIANTHFINLDVFVETNSEKKIGLKKAIFHCIKKLALKPINWVSNEQFLSIDMQMFAMIPEYGMNTGKYETVYRILHMEAKE